MPTFSPNSMHQLTTCDVALQTLFLRVVREYDNTVIEGHRTEERQNEMVANGRSKAPWPQSKHNTSPSMAVDVGPYIPGRGIPWPQTPDDWNDPTQRNAYIKDLCQWYHFAGFVEAMAQEMGITDLRWGGDWDRDHNVADQTFDDLPHFELMRG